MGNCFQSKNDGIKITQIKKELQEVFNLLDTKKNAKLLAQQMETFWTGNYAKTNNDIFFRQIDLNRDNIITQQEWFAYWQLVLECGYSKKQVQTSLETIRNGKLDLNYEKVKQKHRVSNKYGEIIKTFQTEKRNSVNKPIQDQEQSKPQN